jgi:hypothetical protein
VRLADRLRFMQDRVLTLPVVGISVALPVAVTILGFASHHASVLRYLLPAMLPICAAAIWFRNRSAYFGFLLAVWFFIPFLRRLVDYSAGPLDPNPMLLAPYLTTLAVPLLRIRTFLAAPIARVLPFVLCYVGIGIGLATGLFSYQATSVVHDCLNWITPVAFAAFLTLEGPREYSTSLQKWFPLLLVVCAVYTLLQFAFVFPWDIAWLVSLDAPSQGATDPFTLRAFGLLNSAGTAAFVLAAGSLFILNLRRWWRLPAFFLTVLALLTTQVRAGWLVLAIGVLVSFCKSPKAIGAAVGILAVLGMSLSILGLQKSNQNISDRLSSFEHPGDDDSANGRMVGYQAAWDDLQVHPLGRGLGVPEDLFDIQGSFSLLDSAPIHLLATFGWIGGAAYCCGFLLLLVPILRGLAFSDNRTFLVTAIPAVSLTCVFLFGSITVALSGFLIWSFLPPSLVSLGEGAPEKLPVLVRASEPLRGFR